MRIASRIAGTVALLGLLVQVAGAQDKPNFSGKWKLDASQSQMGGGMGMGGGGRPGGGGPPGGGPPGGGPPAGGAPGGGMGNQEVTITHDATTLRIVQQVAGESRTMTYTIGGSASKNPMGMGRMQAEMTTTTVWAGNTLVTEGKATMSGPNGDMEISSREVRSLSADGKTMTVETTTITARGENTRKMVYTKA